MSKQLLYILTASLIACCIEVDISAPSFPDISDYFAISDGLTQMTIAVNFLGFCLSAAVYGPLSEVLGRRKIMLYGNALMTIGAFGCAISSSIEMLLISRFIQGIGASTSAVIVFAMVADICHGPEAAEIIAKINSLLTVIMSVAPIAGGFINELLGWRGNYTVVFLVTFLSWILLYLFLPETKKQFEKFNKTKVIRDYITLFSSPAFVISSLIPSLQFSGYMSFIACGAFLYMETYNLDIMHYAILQGFIIATFSITSQKANYICSFLGSNNSILYGNILIICSGVILFLSALLAFDNPYLVTFLMMMGAFGAAISYPLIFAKSFEFFPEIHGTASSAIMSIRMLITSIFIAVSSFFYNGTLFRVSVIIIISNILVGLMTAIFLRMVNFNKKN